MEAVIAESSTIASLEKKKRVSDFAALKIAVELYGYIVSSNVSYDGDCFFHSLAVALGGLSDSKELRQQLVEFFGSKVNIILLSDVYNSHCHVQRSLIFFICPN